MKNKQFSHACYNRTISYFPLQASFIICDVDMILSNILFIFLHLRLLQSLMKQR